jgi:hypothetical protein
MPLDPEFKRHLAELYAEDDRLRAEARRQERAAASAAAADTSGLLYRDYTGGAPYDAPAGVAAPANAEGAYDWSGWEKWLAGHLAIHQREMGEGVAWFVSNYLREKLTPLRQELAALHAENVEVKGLLTETLRKYDEVTKEFAELKARGARRILLPGD